MADIVSKELESYAESHTTDVAPLFYALRDETFAKMSSPGMQVGRTEGQFLRLLAKLVGAKRILEIGMFTGYSGLMMAEALPDDGELITCDVNPKAEEMAKRYHAQSAHGRKIKIRMGPALETIKTLKPPFDMVFIDADKENYPAYWDAVMPLVRSGGIIVGDNVLWSGRVVDPNANDEDTVAIRAFNDKIQADERVENVLLSVRDGMMLARKK